MMMVKEHFVKSFGAPTHTLGWGCSGGSYQAEQIADNYPGLLDGIVVGCSFPDVGHAAVTVNSFGARLVYEFYSKLAHLPWSKEQIVAVSGLADFLSLETAGKRNSRIDPTSKCSASIAPNLLYEATSNPTGARCSIYDHGATGFGRDPKTGFGRRPLDNVGVQFGLGALNAGAISIAQFIELNQLIGGLDIDAKRTPARSTGDRVALRRGYQTGRFLFGGAGLAQIPVIDYRAYVDFKNGDNHQRFHSFSIRARMLAANGDIANHVMLTESDKYGLFSLESPHLEEALEQMDAWVSNIAADSTPGSAHQRVARARPLGLVDACFTQDDKKISEQQVYGRATHCNALYPPHSNPHIVAGESIANNVVKCSLKALDLSDYTVRLNAAELLALKSVFVDGVCDYKKPGIEQQPLIGTWVSFGPA